mmetsp:Transcript_20365/g.30379  ORF Transcript_20365/g.30379 Transcript_20365/m.30379 type:complete len:411 (-) Transcript_20365:278-1510(-)|eukprot:CAMPEP_0116007592 /NCGR_PEP_ID=MMETSP0321-20121206/2385_1 /TAXON_ID=163516 /ORGANISM="Leptocylindrus danicus var. danicus, Strain B650" /LENGTH=410 /DNA_ID=CAMNT_0003476305 /DNA_START=1214 /DNA_END=2446 /DNA_ORIENTATION=-
MNIIEQRGKPSASFQNRVVHTDFKQVQKFDDSDIEEISLSLTNDDDIDWELPTDQLRLKFQELQNAAKQRRDSQFDRKFAEHTRRYDTDILRSRMYDEWGFENDARRAAQVKEDAEKAEIIRLQKVEECKLAHRRAKQDAEAAQWRETHEETQYILKMMRRAGVVDGVNNPPAKPVELPLDEFSAKRIVIRCVSKSVVVEENIANSDSTATTVDGGLKLNINLRNCCETTEIQGHQIGYCGARILSRNLLDGSCPKLTRLLLGWNNIQVLGLKELMNAVASKDIISSIKFLDLKANSINSKGLKYFQAAIHQGSLPFLEHLDLSKNPVRSDGARMISHAILGGRFVCLSTLNMDACQIDDAGIHALFLCCSAPKFTSCLMPKARALSAKRNLPSGRLLRICKPWPGVLKV